MTKRDDKIREVLKEVHMDGYADGKYGVKETGIMVTALTALKPLMLEEIDEKEMQEIIEQNTQDEEYEVYTNDLAEAICAKYRSKK